MIVDSIISEMRGLYRERDKRPWVIGFSGGKDSTLVAQLVMDMLLDLPPSQRTRAVHVVCNDTLVESPIVQAFVDKTLGRMREAMRELKLPVTVVKTQPEASQTFWLNVIGRGYPAPTRAFRWCTDRMKIRPTSKHVRDLISASGEVILLLGVRRQESATRAASVARHDNGTLLNPHSDLKGCMVYRPIVELSTEDVWQVLLQRRPRWGGTHRELVTLYRNGQAGECPFVIDADDAPSCGENPSSRFGCWTCTVVEKDKSLEGFIIAGFEHLEPLVEFRDWLKAFTYDPANRQGERRDGGEGLGPLSIAARGVVLERLLATQSEAGVPLISPSEVEACHRQWDQDRADKTLREAKFVLNVIGDKL